MDKVVFDENLVTFPFKLWGIWFLLEVFKPTADLTKLIEISLKVSTYTPGLYLNISAFGFGLGLSLTK